MTRELKFRAWDGEKMWYPETPSYDGSDTFFALYNDKQKTIGWGLYDRKLENRLVSGEYNETEIMQYTGLKDKNGKEIYEGDLIKHGAFTYEVVFAEFGWYARCNDAGIPSEDLKAWLANGSEIIGNIYESA